MAKKTTYTDKDGIVREGYIENGVTYTDATLKNQVPVGSVVNTAGGAYFKSANGGVLVNPATGGDTFSWGGKNYEAYYDGDNAYMDKNKTTKVPTGVAMQKNGASYYNDERLGITPTMSGAKSNYETSMAGMDTLIKESYTAQKDASQARMNSRLRALKKREEEIKREKAEADRNSYNAYLQSINPYGARAQQIARLGLSNSGFGETSLAKLGASYQEALAGNERARADAMRELTSLCDQARSEGNAEQYEIYANMYNALLNLGKEKATMTAQFDTEAAQTLERKLAQDEANRREDAIREAEYEREDRIRAEENAREDREIAEERAWQDKWNEREMAYKNSSLNARNTSSKSLKKTSDKGFNEEAMQDIVKRVLNGRMTIGEAAKALGFSEEQMAILIRTYYTTDDE